MISVFSAVLSMEIGIQYRHKELSHLKYGTHTYDFYIFMYSLQRLIIPINKLKLSLEVNKIVQ